MESYATCREPERRNASSIASFSSNSRIPGRSTSRMRACPAAVCSMPLRIRATSSGSFTSRIRASEPCRSFTLHPYVRSRVSA